MISLQSDVARAKPNSAAARWAAASVTSATVRSSMSKGRSKTFNAVATPNTCVLPIKPVPISPARSLGLALIESPSVYDESRIDTAIQIVNGIPDGADRHPFAALGGQARDMGRQDYAVVGKQARGRPRGFILEDVQARRADHRLVALGHVNRDIVRPAESGAEVRDRLHFAFRPSHLFEIGIEGHDLHAEARRHAGQIPSTPAVTENQ